MISKAFQDNLSLKAMITGSIKSKLDKKKKSQRYQSDFSLRAK